MMLGQRQNEEIGIERQHLVIWSSGHLVIEIA
jgi:hypothetical protein